MGTTRETIAVAIDFGTTYSGIALMGDKSKRLIQLGQWPGQPSSSTSYKVPTIILYPDGGGAPLWGFEAEKQTYATTPKLRVFKPFLDSEFQNRYHAPPGKTLHDVVRDYIQGMYQHLTEFLANERMSGDLNFLLTIPATYGGNTVETFRQIIKTTGIGRYAFSVGLTEPEAASLHTMQAMTMQASSMYSVNDCFIVCDAGGGTVDLSSYNIVKLDPTIQVEHTGVVLGKYCGSTMIDKEFAAYIKSLIGDAAWKQLGSRLDPVNKRFIVEKERFNNSPYDENFNILFGDIPCPGKKGPYLPISRNKMKEFFSVSLLEIQQMIRSHIEECRAKGHRVKYIFLVGGLGSSPYIKVEVDRYCRDIDPSIQVIQPPDAQQAVVLGAVVSHMRSLRREEDPVVARNCRKNYGLLITKPYDRTKNFEYEKTVDPISGEPLAKEQITWLIREGDRITGGPERCIEYEFIREFELAKDNSGASWEEVVVEFSGDNPPHRAQPGVSKVCILNPDLSNRPRTEFTKMKKKKPGFLSKSLKYYQVKYTIKIYVGTVGVVKAEMFYKGELFKVLWGNQ